jgi:ubiquinone/menaquinone biosynthesis C-methylase UbiE
MVVITPVKKRDLGEMLASIYSKQQALADHPYIRQHSSTNSILRHVDIFARYLPQIADKRVVLDWGCAHAPDACLLRQSLGDRVELHGCDFAAPGSYSAFHNFAKLQYTQLNDPLSLPFGDETFDAVIGSGVLEHVAMVGQSLGELHRIIVEGGILVVSFLPNRWSYTEFAARHLGVPAHRRLFGRTEAVRLLRHYGFDPVLVGYSQFSPAHQFQRLFRHLWPLNPILERMWPTRMFCANHILVAVRRSFM